MHESIGRLAACVACALWVGCGGDVLQNPPAPSTGSPAMQASAGTPADAPSMTAKPADASDVAAKPEDPPSPATPTSGVKPAAAPAAQPAQPSAAAAPQLAAGAQGFLQDAGDGWQGLVIGSWELAPGLEGYRCQRFTLPHDISAGAFRGLNPPGTHHTQLWVVNEGDATPDGSSECTSTTISNLSVAGSGVGANDLTFPKGVAVTFKAGQQLLLNLHLFNVTDKPLRGTSGTLFKRIAEADVVHQAELFLPGTATLNIPPGGPTKQSGVCTLTEDTTLFALTPHMHQLGVHLKAVARSSIMGQRVMSDRPYSFDEQLFYPLDPPIQMKRGDTIEVECTYMNTTAKTVAFGDSSLEEMCFASTYRYPAVGRPVCIR